MNEKKNGVMNEYEEADLMAQKAAGCVLTGQESCEEGKHVEIK